MTSELSCRGDKDGMFCFEEEGLIEAKKLVAISTLGVALTCEYGNDSISCFVEEVLNDPVFIRSFDDKLTSKYDSVVISYFEKKVVWLVMTLTLAKLACGVGNNCISCFDEDVVSKSIRLVISFSGAALTCVGDSDDISCFGEEVAVESIRLVAIWTSDVELTCECSNDDMSSFKKEVLRLFVASTFGAAFACKDDDDSITCFDEDVVSKSIRLVISLSGAAITCVGDSDEISCFGEEVAVESIRLVTIWTSYVELTCECGNDDMSSFDKEVLRLFVASTFGAAFACKDDNGSISCFDVDVVNKSIRFAVICTSDGDLSCVAEYEGIS